MDHSLLKKYFPVDKLGTPTSFTPINVGLSGSLVYSVTAENNEYIMRIHRSTDGEWDRILSVQSLASLHKITPEVHYVDEKEHVVISTRVSGPSLGEALRDQTRAMKIFSGLIENLEKLHALPKNGVKDIDPIGIVQKTWKEQSQRSGFPQWALPLGGRLNTIEQILKTDPQKVVSHNDLNPANILCDENRVWLIDWEIAGLNHPYYDLAALMAFLNLPIELAEKLLSAQEKSELTAEQKILFGAYCELAAILYGVLFLTMQPDLNLIPQTNFDETLTLSQCYEKMAKGEMVLQNSTGQAYLAMAMLKKALS